MKKTGLAVFAGALLLSGCIPAYNVEVYMSPKVKEKYQVRPSLELDIAGVNTADKEHFQAIAVDDYFTPENALRESSKHATLHFSEEDAVAKRITKNDPVWEKFSENAADTLYLLVNLPVSGAKSLKTDPRKVAIPLKWCLFSKTRYFEITPSGLVQLTEVPEYAPEEIETESTEEK